MTWYPTQSHYPDTKTTRPCPILIMQSAWLGSDTYQFWSHWFDSIRVWTNDLWKGKTDALICVYNSSEQSVKWVERYSGTDNVYLPVMYQWGTLTSLCEMPHTQVGMGRVVISASPESRMVRMTKVCVFQSRSTHNDSDVQKYLTAMNPWPGYCMTITNVLNRVELSLCLYCKCATRIFVIVHMTLKPHLH